ncbi:hypothetical protein [Arsukibacterium sp.]|uniref:hypothetical protein n=1 Tax=Arsukibacterium sp. TaxID=1977258 RepID=UPI002FD9C1E2
MKWCYCLLLCLSLNSLGVKSLTAPTDIPSWLKQLSTEKYREPNQMLAVLQERQGQFDTAPPRVQAYWLAQQAAIFGVLGLYQQQQTAARQGLALLGDSDSPLRIELLYELGYAQEMQVELPQAMSHYQQGLALATLLDLEKLILRGKINVAAIDNLQDRDQQALTQLKEVYQRAQLLQDAEVLAEINAQLGLLYSALAFEQEALGFLQKALQLYEQLGWRKNRIAVLYNLASTYSHLGQYENALETFHQMLQSSLQAEDAINLYHAYMGLAITSNEMGRGDAALGYIDKAEQYLTQLQSAMHVSTHYYEKARIYQSLQQSSLAMQQVLLAEQYFAELELDSSSHIQLAFLMLKAEILADQGQYEKAYYQLQRFTMGFQQYRDKENELAIERMRLGFDSDRQQVRTSLLEAENELKALRLQQAERQRQIQWLWLGLFICTTLILLGILLWQLGQRKRQPGDTAP